jgi:hypothetical protein
LNKYRNQKTAVDGIVFDSKKESRRYLDLKRLQQQGEVLSFERQVSYKFACGVKYKLDFQVYWKDGHVSYEDVKGVVTPVYKLKKKMMNHEFGIDITEI